MRILPFSRALSKQLHKKLLCVWPIQRDFLLLLPSLIVWHYHRQRPYTFHSGSSKNSNSVPLPMHKVWTFRSKRVFIGPSCFYDYVAASADYCFCYLNSVSKFCLIFTSGVFDEWNEALLLGQGPVFPEDFPWKKEQTRIVLSDSPVYSSRLSLSNAPEYLLSTYVSQDVNKCWNPRLGVWASVSSTQSMLYISSSNVVSPHPFRWMSQREEDSQCLSNYVSIYLHTWMPACQSMCTWFYLLKVHSRKCLVCRKQGREEKTLQFSQKTLRYVLLEDGGKCSARFVNVCIYYVCVARRACYFTASFAEQSETSIFCRLCHVIVESWHGKSKKEEKNETLSFEMKNILLAYRLLHARHTHKGKSVTDQTTTHSNYRASCVLYATYYYVHFHAKA